MQYFFIENGSDELIPIGDFSVIPGKIITAMRRIPGTNHVVPTPIRKEPDRFVLIPGICIGPYGDFTIVGEDLMIYQCLGDGFDGNAVQGYIKESGKPSPGNLAAVNTQVKVALKNVRRDA